MVDGHAAVTRSGKDAVKVFDHAAKTSNVEWSLHTFKNGEIAVGTLHLNDQAPEFKSLGEAYSTDNTLTEIHSHSGKNPAVDFQPSSYDENRANTVRINNPNANFVLFMPQNPTQQYKNNTAVS